MSTYFSLERFAWRATIACAIMTTILGITQGIWWPVLVPITSAVILAPPTTRAMAVLWGMVEFRSGPPPGSWRYVRTGDFTKGGRTS